MALQAKKKAWEEHEASEGDKKKSSAYPTGTIVFNRKGDLEGYDFKPIDTDISDPPTWTERDEQILEVLRGLKKAGTPETTPNSKPWRRSWRHGRTSTTTSGHSAKQMTCETQLRRKTC